MSATSTRICPVCAREVGLYATGRMRQHVNPGKTIDVWDRRRNQWVVAHPVCGGFESESIAVTHGDYRIRSGRYQFPERVYR